MSTRIIALGIAVACAALAGCAQGPEPIDGPDAAAADGTVTRRPETRAERYARGEYRRGFGEDTERQGEFCRLHPADTGCIGRRF